MISTSHEPGMGVGVEAVVGHDRVVTCIQLSNTVYRQENR